MKMRLTESFCRRKRERIFPVISEIKVRSKKEGDLLRGRDPLDILRQMTACPVAGISVVTEPEHFGGSMALLRQVAVAVDLPVLHKDFNTTVDQIRASAEAGASAVLLTAAMLTDQQLAELIEAARRYGLESLVEVHDIQELRRVEPLDFNLLGINNRDITILECDDADVGRTEHLAGFRAIDKPLISESAISGADDVRRAGKSGADAVLVGTAVLKAPNIGDLLTQLTSVGWPV
jgi:indole-3-glycerol phosphate synthase